MRLYPAFLNLKGQRCLIVGGGQVGLRKARSLAECDPAEVLVVDPAPPSRQWRDLRDAGPIVYAERPFEDSDLDGRALVFAATADAGVNERVMALCAGRGILSNRAETPEESGFIVPAHFRRGDLLVALSTGGGSPALARVLRRELEARFGEHYAAMVRVMARLRPLVLALGLEQADNAALFRDLAESGLLEALRGRDMAGAARILEQRLPEALHARIPEVLDGI